MSSSLRPRFPWWLTALGIAMLALLVVLVRQMRLPEVPVVKKKAPPPMVVTTLNSRQASEAINEQSNLLDPTPLFLPTPLNASQQGKPVAKRELGEAFDAFPARLQNQEAELGLSPQWSSEVPKNLSAVLALGETPNPLRGIVKEGTPPVPLASRLGAIEVVDARTGQVCLQIEVPPSAATDGLMQDWRPMELLISMREAGVVGMPVVVASSGISQIDQFFRRHVAGIFRLGHRIPPGTYTLRIGP